MFTNKVNKSKLVTNINFFPSCDPQVVIYNNFIFESMYVFLIRHGVHIQVATLSSRQNILNKNTDKKIHIVKVLSVDSNIAFSDTKTETKWVCFYYVLVIFIN